MKSFFQCKKSLFILFCSLAVAIGGGCSSDDSEDPDAQTPKITAITSDITTAVHVAKGLSVGAEVSDSGTLSYQWYVAESKLSEGTAIENADSATFTPETTKTGTSYYYCVITNRLGSSIRTVISPRITYTVNEWICAQEPVIIKYPESIQADFGENFSLATVAYSADGGTLSYQWYFCAGKDGDPIALTDARQPILKGKVSSDTLGYYYCEITNVIPDNGDGGEKSASVRTAGAEVSSTQIKAQNPVVLQQPQNIKQDFGSTFTLSVTTYSADGGTLSYQWYYTSDGEASATPISGATKATYTSDISARTLGQYYCEITNTISDNGDGGSKTATVRTNTTEVSSTQIKAQNPVVLQQPQNIKQDFGSTFTLSVTTYSTDGGTLSYQWYYKLGEEYEATKIISAVEPKYEKELSAQTLGWYFCEITNTIPDNGDGGAKTAVVRTNEAAVSNTQIAAKSPLILQQPQSIKQDFGSAFALSTTAYSVDGGTLSYQWYHTLSKETEAMPVSGATEPAYSGKLSAQTLGWYFCEITNTIPENGDGGKKTANIRTSEAEISNNQVKAKSPVILQQPQNIKQDFGSTFTLSVTAYSADGGMLSYQWYHKASEKDEFTKITGAVDSKYEKEVSAQTLGWYSCEITNTISDNGDGGEKTALVQTPAVTVSNDTINANAPVIFTTLEDIALHVPEKATLTVSAYSADKGTLSYQWHKTEGDTDTAIAGETRFSCTVTAEKVGSAEFYCVVTNTITDNGDGGTKTATARSNSAKVTVSRIDVQKPVILTTLEDVALHVPEKTTLTVSAYSADKGTLSYQWHKTEGDTDTAIAGETKSSCTVTAEKVGSAEFYCVVTNTITDNGDGGTKTATARSNSAKVTVSRIDVQKPVILTTLEDVALHVPEKATLTVSAYSADKGTLSYQWHKTEDDTDTAIAGETKSSCTVTAEKVGSAEFYCVVTNTIADNGDGGTKTATARSNSAKVTVSRIDVQKPVILTTLEDVALHVPEKTTLTVSAYATDGGTLSYQWYKTEDDKTTAIEGATESAYDAVAEKVGSAEFYCVVTSTITDNGDGGTKTATARSNSAKVTVSRIDVQKPVILTTLEDIALHVPEKATLTVSAYATDGGTLSYQWYKTEDDKTAAIEGETKSSCTVTAEKVGSAEFYCVVTNTIADNGDGGTKTATARSNSAKVTVSRIDVQKPVILTELKDVSLHVPEKTTLIVLAYSTDGGKLSYQWYKTEDDKTAAIEGATESAYDAVAEKVGSAEFYCVVTSTITDNGDGGVKTDYVLSNSAKITVEQVDVQKPVIKMQPKDATVVIPAIQAFSVNAYAADDGILTYQWYSVPDGQTAGTAIEGETNARLIVRVQELGKTGYYCIVTNTIDDNGDGGTKLASVQTDTAWFDAIYLKNVVSAPAFTKQPPALNVAPYNQHIEISCEAESAQGNVSYRWYQSTDGTTDTGIPVIGATTQTLTTPFYTERGIHYYYCVATTILSAEDGESIKSAASFSDIVTVACTGLPLLTITTVNGEEPTCDYKASPTGWGAGITNATKVPARMIITRGNETVYDSGDYIAKTSGLTIKIRGNTSAYGIKKPYKLKLQKKADLLKHKRDDVNDHSDKNWILLRDATSLKTKVGLKVADKVGFAWTPTYDYVDVLMNGTYRGVYMLIESIERADCRINVKKNGFIIERDAYWWNEDLYFETEDSMKASWKYTFKYPDTDGDIAEGDENFEYIKDYVNTAWNTLSDGTYESYIDVDSFAKWLIAHDILGSKDWAGSNIYLSKYDQTDTSKLQMETPWDFDTIYSMNEAWSNIHIVKGFFFPFLFANTNKAFVAQYKQKWADVKDSVWADIKTDLNAFAAETEEGLNIARKLDAEKYGITYKTVSEDIADAENWFSSRLTWLNTQITALSE